MPIYRIEDKKIVPIQSTTFKEQGLLERSDLQALRYAAMISTLTFDRLVTVYEEYLSPSDTGNV